MGGSLVASGLLAGSTVSYVPSIHVQFLGDHQQPLPGTWVAYRYRGSRFNFVDSLSYERPGALVQVASDGRVSVPGFLHVHAPLDGGLEPVLDWVFSPQQHNFSRPWSLEPRSIPGRFEILTDPIRIVLRSYGEAPDLWEQSLRDLHSVLRSQRLTADAGRYDIGAAQRVRLEKQLSQELEAFRELHAGRPALRL